MKTIAELAVELAVGAIRAARRNGERYAVIPSEDGNDA